jgi:hypothetical protein
LGRIDTELITLLWPTISPADAPESNRKGYPNLTRD